MLHRETHDENSEAFFSQMRAEKMDSRMLNANGTGLGNPRSMGELPSSNILKNYRISLFAIALSRVLLLPNDWQAV